MKISISNFNKSIGFSILISVFSLWSTMRQFESLWPGMKVRPLAVPALWIFLMLSSLILCMPSLKRSFNKKWILFGLIIFVIILPVVLGYSGLLLQVEDISFILKE
jgi:hypothetical protein